MDVLHRNIYIVEKITVKLDGVAAGHEDHDLLLLILAKECEEELELDLWLADDNVALLQVLNGLGRALLGNFDQHRILQ